MSSNIMKIKPGRFAKVVDDGERLMLCAVDEQNQQTNQTGYHPVIVTKSNNSIAFTCSIITENSVATDYILKVNGSSLEMVPFNQSDQVDGFPPAGWFEMDGYGDYYKVRVPSSPPHKYICIEEDTKEDAKNRKRTRKLFLSDNANAVRAYVKDEAN